MFRPISFSFLAIPILGLFLNARAEIIPGKGSSNAIVPGSEKLEAILGSAYDSDREAFLGDRCIEPQATPTYAGQATSQFTFSQSIDQKSLASHLGFGEEASGQYGAVKASEAANFMSNASSDELSVSAVWISSYVFPSIKVLNPQLSTIGTRVANNFERWPKTCGDQYVNEIITGGKLFFSIRVQFASATEKNEFSANFSISGPLAGVSSNLEKASTQFSRHTKVYIDVYQIGGDVSKLTSVLNGATESLQKCELGDFEKCSTTITNALNYASDTKSGFPSQLAVGALPGAVPLLYKTAPYTAIGIYPTDYPGLADAVYLARNEVSKTFQDNYKLSISATRLLDVQQSELRTEKIRSEKENIDRNIETLLDASKICYNEPQNCYQEWQKKKAKLLAVNRDALKPETFLTFCLDSEKSDENNPIRITVEAIRAAVDASSGFACSDLDQKISRLSKLELRSNPSNPISDLRPLANLIRLQKLIIVDANVSNLNPISNLIRLKFLSFAGNWIDDLNPISDMQGLLTLDLSNNRIKNISPLIGMHKLQFLNLSSNYVEDLSDSDFEKIFYPQLIQLDLQRNNLKSEFVTKLSKKISDITTVNYSLRNSNEVKKDQGQ